MGDGNTPVTLTATLTKGDETETKTFEVTVIALQTDAEAVAEAADAVDIDYTDGDTADSVTQDVVLTDTGTDGVAVAWESSDPSVIGTDGTVTRPGTDTIVILTATLAKGEETETKTFMVTVDGTDDEDVAAAVDALDIDYAPGDSSDSVTQDVTLTTTGTNGVAVSWESSDPSVIGTDGTVARPGADTIVTLTATLAKGEETETKTFMVTVDGTDDEDVAAAAAALDIDYAPGDSSDSVTQDVTLTTTGTNGVAVSWESSDPSVIGTDGTVARPGADTIVTLTATLAKGEETETKTFMVTVDGTDDEDVAAAVDALKVEYATGDDADSVTQDVTLAKNGENDVAITWASSDLSVIGADGTVTRPGTDIIVILTATLAKGEASDTKEFTLTVIGTFTLAHITSIDDTDNDAYALYFPGNTATATVGGTTYLFVTGYNDHGVSVFSVATDGTLTHTATVNDSDNTEYELHQAYAVTTAAVGTTTYLFVGGNDDGVSVFSVANDGTLTYATSISDNTTYNLDGPFALTTAAIGSATYLFVAGRDDDGISVFSVSNSGMLTHVTSVDDSDNADYQLDGALGVTTATLGGTTYLFVAGRDDDGVSVFSVSSSDMLTHVTSVDDSDNADYQLDGAFGYHYCHIRRDNLSHYLVVL